MVAGSIDKILIHIVFPFITLAGLYVVSNLMINSGHAQLFVDSRALAVPLLPDGETLLRTFYTGVPALDSYLANLQFSIFPTVDGSSPALSLLGWHWMGLLLAVFTAMLVESLRSRRTRDLVLFALWGLAIQYAGYFIIMPLYCYVHLLSRPATSNAKMVPTSAAIQAVPVSVLVGLVFPSVAMCLSNRFHSSQSRQVAVAVWQNFPAWMAVIQILATKWIETGSGQQQEEPEMKDKRLNSSRSARRRVYKVVATASALIHILGLVPIVLAATGWPEDSASSQPSHIRPGTFFLPPRWDRKMQINGMADGAFNFLRYDYYVGNVAALAWVMFLQFPALVNWNAGSTGRLVFRDIACIFVLGPGFTIVNLMDRRDGRVTST
ncbi:atma protein [Colletotrichum incanum]|uniref:Atma protein n=1 Tax=Colletotrichum incanum TaxID=1573173 RepID=A0A161W0I7_COLIC|nr:atma protein [Colletotrichum incanum]